MMSFHAGRRTVISLLEKKFRSSPGPAHVASGPPPPYPAVTAVPLPALPAHPLCNTRYDELDSTIAAASSLWASLDTTHYSRARAAMASVRLDAVAEQSLLQQHDAERAVPPREHGVRRRVEGDAGGLHGESI